MPFDFHFYIRLAGDIDTKSKNTKKHILNVLRRNISKAVTYFGHKSDLKLRFNLITIYDHFEIQATHDISSVLSSTPGIQSFSKVDIILTQDYKETLESAGNFFKEKVVGKKFAVRCRSYSSAFRTMKVERELGSLLFDYSEGVNLTNPDITCHIWVRKKNTYLFSEIIQGMGGFPVGSMGKAMLLFSGGIDSPIAAWYLFRSGVELDFIYFDLGSDEQKELAIELAQHMLHTYGAGPKSSIRVVEYTKVMTELGKIDSAFQNLGLKYCFYKSSSYYVEKTNSTALATGEAIGQVSTQTLSNLSTLDTISDLSVIRPLITSPKVQIMHKAQSLGIFDMTYQGKEFCALSTKNVRTKSTRETLDNAMVDFNWDILNQVHYDSYALPIYKPESWRSFTKKKSKVKGIQKVIWLGENPPKEENTEKMDFQIAWDNCLHWDKDLKYHIVCETGQQSAFLAQFMSENGFEVSSASEKGNQ